jgi:hypothetical protein
MRSLRLVIIAVLGLVTASETAHADFDIAGYKQQVQRAKTDALARFQVSAYFEGAAAVSVGWEEFSNEVKHVALFCPPRKAPLTAEVLQVIVDQYIAGHLTSPDQQHLHLSLAIVFSLIDAYPCK